MSLVVKGRQSLEILEDWVKNKFTFVKDNKLILPSFARTSKAFSLDKLGKIVWLKNKQPTKTLDIIFPFREI